MALMSSDAEPAGGECCASTLIWAVAKLHFSLACHLRPLLFHRCLFLQTVQISRTVQPGRNVSPSDPVRISQWPANKTPLEAFPWGN